MLQGPGFLAPQDPIEDAGVDHAPVQTQVVVEGGSDVPHRVELLPHPRRLQALSVLRDVETWGGPVRPVRPGAQGGPGMTLCFFSGGEFIINEETTQKCS